VRRTRRAYYGAISYLDDNVGELLATLRTFGLAEDTIVILTADHGELPGERGLWYKMHLFERAMRVPLIVHAPGRCRFPRRVAAPVSLIDLLPTVVDLGRLAAGTADLEHDGDGRSLVPLLEGLNGEERDALAEYLAEGALAPILMIRWGAHKFIWSDPDAPLLFDLEQEPDELDNLAARPEHAEPVRAFEAELRRHCDPQALHRAIVASQRTRRLAWKGLEQGRKAPWEWDPALHRAAT
jgi:choline-sulfatase